jgi:hypothetical protein
MDGFAEHPTVLAIQREWRRLNGTLDSASSEQMLVAAFDPEFGSDPWTIKDLLVHIAAWKRNTIRVVEMVRADPGSVPELGTPDDILEIDYDAFNRDLQARWAACSLDEAESEHRAAHADLMAALETIPLERIPEPVTRNIWPYPAIWHSKAHRLDILDALDR